MGDLLISSKARYDVAKNAKINLSNDMVMSKNHTGLFGLLFMLYSRILCHKFINQDEKLEDDLLLKNLYIGSNSGTQKNQYNAIKLDKKEKKWELTDFDRRGKTSDIRTFFELATVICGSNF